MSARATSTASSMVSMSISVACARMSSAVRLSVAFMAEPGRMFCGLTSLPRRPRVWKLPTSRSCSAFEDPPSMSFASARAPSVSKEIDSSAAASSDDSATLTRKCSLSSFEMNGTTTWMTSAIAGTWRISGDASSDFTSEGSASSVATSACKSMSVSLTAPSSRMSRATSTPARTLAWYSFSAAPAASLSPGSSSPAAFAEP
mmetsp:Transcript_14186/g.44103  ORF Transcript_14186/g.44103 Transcript_14186/m.44103 type:complete len:202 (-) Transcript_14186:24-629(-)